MRDEIAWLVSSNLNYRGPGTTNLVICTATANAKSLICYLWGCHALSNKCTPMQVLGTSLPTKRSILGDPDFSSASPNYDYPHPNVAITAGYCNQASPATIWAIHSCAWDFTG